MGGGDSPTAYWIDLASPLTYPSARMRWSPRRDASSAILARVYLPLHAYASLRFRARGQWE